MRAVLLSLSPRGLAAVLLAMSSVPCAAVEPIQVGFLWHMHQPIYIPGQNVLQTESSGQFSFSVVDVHNQRVGPYTDWPRDAIQAGQSLPHLGAQISFSGSLIQNLNTLEAGNVNGGMWNDWNQDYQALSNLNTTLGNPRGDMVGFGFFHALMPLLDERDMRMQIKLHKQISAQTFGPEYSRGFFPAETAFSTRMIPALVAEGMEWTIVDNIHFDRATQNYPHTNASGLYAPNRADQINPDPTTTGGAWVQLQNVWAPSRVSTPFSYRPHYTQHVDPATGEISQLVAVPGARYEGNEDARGGYGAFLYDQVMDAYLPYNTDPNHPMLVVLHHDGDNYGGGSESYYHSNFQNMVNWASLDPDYDVSTIQDYLQRYPVNPNDVIHVEAGSWAGADNGDPEFRKWLGDPGPTGFSPDRNSWAVLTAAKNRVFTADDIAPYTNLQNIIDNTGSPTEKAWHHLLTAESSDYWYWDGTEVWDSNVTRGSNLAVAEADQVIAGFTGSESTPPTVFLPQRDTYNPGAYEFNATPEPSDFDVWTYAYDVSGLQSVKLKWRADLDGFNPLDSTHNETYAGGPEVGGWNELNMVSSDVNPPANILSPAYRALKYSARIEGQDDVLLDYYVEAVDGNGNVTRSDIQHVYVGSADAGNLSVTINPDPAVAGELVTVSYDASGGPLAGANPVFLHYGFDQWSTVISPDQQMQWNAATQRWDAMVPVISSATQLDLVFHDGSGTWDNNNGQDWHFAVEGGTPAGGFDMNGALDSTAVALASHSGQTLYAALIGDVLYVATQDAGEGNDHFIYVADQPGDLVSANWAKSGMIAAWDAFLADENDNGFDAWFGAAGSADSATGANGGVLEGMLNLRDEFGNLPTEVWIAMGAFQTADAGILVRQVPASLDGNLDINAAEYFQLQLHTLRTADFNRDGDFAVSDIDQLIAAIASGGNNRHYDLTGDGLVDLDDLTAWLAEAGAAELDTGNPYMMADANLDGVVDGQDFVAWNNAKFTGTARWSAGDFNADGFVDGQDFVLWNGNKFQSAGTPQRPPAVPEPTAVIGATIAGGLAMRRRRVG